VETPNAPNGRQVFASGSFTAATMDTKILEVPAPKSNRAMAGRMGEL
jgi:hypothetical protein